MLLSPNSVQNVKCLLDNSFGFVTVYICRMCVYFLPVFYLYKWIYNLLACLLLPIKTKEWGACKMIKKERKKIYKSLDLEKKKSKLKKIEQKDENIGHGEKNDTSKSIPENITFKIMCGLLHCIFYFIASHAAFMSIITHVLMCLNFQTYF